MFLTVLSVVVFWLIGALVSAYIQQKFVEDESLTEMPLMVILKCLILSWIVLFIMVVKFIKGDIYINNVSWDEFLDYKPFKSKGVKDE